MAAGRTEIRVYADWIDLQGPACMGRLLVQHTKGRSAFSFSYDPFWLSGKYPFQLDPDLAFFSGNQYPGGKENFGMFLDSMPDTWGRTLMRRREAIVAKAEGRPMRNLHETDFLLGTLDETRPGALRFKQEKDGPFLDDNLHQPTPPWIRLRALQDAVEKYESESDEEFESWYSVLFAPGSSLGGARPKANILDGKGHLWIAKFPSKNDVTDMAAWEYLAYRLAVNCGIEMAESVLEHISGPYRAFITKRFDRVGSQRIHIASAMTMTGQTEETLKQRTASYIDLAEFLQFQGSRNTEDLQQLWRRLVFNIAISNTDDHLRNHGFILKSSGWLLSPAFDLNPSIDKSGLSLNIDSTQSSLDFELAKSVGKLFHLTDSQMDKIISEVKGSVQNWKILARELEISAKEIQIMEPAFRY